MHLERLHHLAPAVENLFEAFKTPERPQKEWPGAHDVEIVQRYLQQLGQHQPIDNQVVKRYFVLVFFSFNLS